MLKKRSKLISFFINRATLIDGDKLLNLVAKYELYVTRKVITTYELADFFREKN